MIVQTMNSARFSRQNLKFKMHTSKGYRDVDICFKFLYDTFDWIVYCAKNHFLTKHLIFRLFLNFMVMGQLKAFHIIITLNRKQF